MRKVKRTGNVGLRVFRHKLNSRTSSKHMALALNNFKRDLLAMLGAVSLPVKIPCHLFFRKMRSPKTGLVCRNINGETPIFIVECMLKHHEIEFDSKSFDTTSILSHIGKIMLNAEDWVTVKHLDVGVVLSII